MNALQIVKRADGPAIATDKRSRILGWNASARELFEHADGKQVVGKRLHSVLDVRDASGNRIDFSQMPLHQMVTRGEPIQGFEIEAKKKTGEAVRLLVSVVVVLGPQKAKWEVVYLLRPIFRRRKADEVIERVLANPANGRHALDRSGTANEKKVPDLTRRQADVLRLLAQGLSNEEIAKTLFLSVFTVRSHVQSILEKLGVHSKVEAVSRAFRDGLI
jgi:DNA-binding CsgD family transcriptional regulator